jgi:hypothetical protein
MSQPPGYRLFAHRSDVRPRRNERTARIPAVRSSQRGAAHAQKRRSLVFFFGGALKMVPNMLRVAMDINGFLDMKKTETFYATEYHLRS